MYIQNRIELTHAMLCSQQWLVLASFPGGGFGISGLSSEDYPDYHD